MEHKNQHYVPQCYLKPWCDPETPEGQEPYVWQFSKDGTRVRRKPPRKIFFQKNMYTIRLPDGGRDLRLEHGLSELEGRFTEVRDQKLEKDLPLDFDDRLVVSIFAAAMQARTPTQVEHVRGQWQQVLDLAARIERRAKEDPKVAAAWAGVPSRGTEIPMEAVQELVENPAQATLKPAIDAMAPILLMMDMAVFVTDDHPGFITSDTPCVVFDPEAYKRPWHLRSPGMGWPTVEVTLPISPRRLLLFNHQGANRIVKASAAAVDELNRRTRFHAKDHFVVCANVTRPIWFEKREPPTGSYPPPTG